MMHKKALLVHIALLSFTMLLGVMLKVTGQNGVRPIHSYSGLAALLASLLVLFVVLNGRATKKQTIFTIVAFISTLMASVGGNMTKTTQEQAGYVLMICSFTVALTVAIVHLLSLRKTQPLKESQP